MLFAAVVAVSSLTVIFTIFSVISDSNKMNKEDEVTAKKEKDNNAKVENIGRIPVPSRSLDTRVNYAQQYKDYMNKKRICENPMKR